MNVTIHEAKTHLSRLIQDALHGEEVVICKGKQPIVRLTPIQDALPKRRTDGAADLIEFMADDFDAELDHFKDYE